MIIFWLILDILFYIVIGLGVLYLLFFSIFSRKKSRKGEINNAPTHRILVLIPAYKEDGVIANAVASIEKQNYPKELFEIAVISDHMQPDTDNIISSLGATVLKPKFEESSKAKALNFAIDYYKNKIFDILVILDADNTVEDIFLEQINAAYFSGYNAIQAHRIAANIDTDTAILDAVSEEINNNIFRKGHNNAGLSSALIGSGMAFDYKWFAANIGDICTAGEDKELELKLLQQRVYILYLENCFVKDYKTKNSKAFYNQRRRWQATQYDTLKRSMAFLPESISTQNYNLLDKIVQWAMLPRVILLMLVMSCTLVTLVVSPWLSIKWIILSLLLLSALCLAIPPYLWNRQLSKAIMKVPLLGCLMIANMLRLKGAARKFIHTKHA